MTRSPGARLALAGGVALAGAASVALAASAQDGAPAARWQSLAPGTLPRTEVALARTADAAYVVGGYVPPEGATTPVAERYDLRTGGWRRIAPMPVALNHASAAAWRGDVYVTGGYDGTAGNAGTRVLLRYRPGTGRWSRLPSMPAARGAHGSAVIGDRLYVVGGATGATPLRRLDVYDLRRRRWRPGPAMPTAREHLGVTAAGGRLHVVAGRAAGRGNLTAHERFDPRTGRWQRLPPLRRARGGNTAATVGRLVVAVGGEEAAGTIAEVEVFDPRTRRWRFAEPMRTPRHGLGAFGFRGAVYAIQGGPQPGLFYSAATERLHVGAP